MPSCAHSVALRRDRTDRRRAGASPGDNPRHLSSRGRSERPRRCRALVVEDSTRSGAGRDASSALVP
jgi:hypothetical protein